MSSRLVWSTIMSSPIPLFICLFKWTPFQREKIDWNFMLNFLVPEPYWLHYQWPFECTLHNIARAYEYLRLSRMYYMFLWIVSYEMRWKWWGGWGCMYVESQLSWTVELVKVCMYRNRPSLWGQCLSPVQPHYSWQELTKLPRFIDKPDETWPENTHWPPRS